MGLINPFPFLGSAHCKVIRMGSKFTEYDQQLVFHAGNHNHSLSRDNSVVVMNPSGKRGTIYVFFSGKTCQVQSHSFNGKTYMLGAHPLVHFRSCGLFIQSLTSGRIMLAKFDRAMIVRISPRLQENVLMQDRKLTAIYY